MLGDKVAAQGDAPGSCDKIKLAMEKGKGDELKHGGEAAAGR